LVAINTIIKKLHNYIKKLYQVICSEKSQVFVTLTVLLNR